MVLRLKLIISLGLIIIPWYALWHLDASMTPPPESQDHPLVLVSFVDGPLVFTKNQQALVMSAADKGFTQIRTYSERDIGADFYSKNNHILDQKRGAGFWLWKPYLILKTLKELPDGAVLVYTDSGLILKKPLAPILDFLKTHDIILMTHGKKASIRKHLKYEAYKAFDFPLDDTILNADNIWAFFMVIRKTPKTMMFLETWLSICQNSDALTDEPFDSKTQDNLFEWHQHDQSILSVLVAKNPEGIYLIPRDVMRKKYGVQNFHRHREEEWKSPLLIQAGLPMWISNVLWNNWFVQKLREKTT